MDQLLKCCENSGSFPINESLLDTHTSDNTLQALFRELEKRKEKIFRPDDGESALHFRESSAQATGKEQTNEYGKNVFLITLLGNWSRFCARNVQELKQHLKIQTQTESREPDPLYRFLLVTFDLDGCPVL
jgi:hypothetical protein